MELQAKQPEDRPESIGRYRLISMLGRGSMAKVYLAFDPNIDRKLALKVLAPAGAVDDEMREDLERRFLLEARAAGNLRHPSAVAIYDADRDVDSGLSFIAMEWVDGESLDRRLRNGRRLPVNEAVSITVQVASALDAAHRQGLIHRDVKPANILLDQQGRAKLSDFGIVKLETLGLTNTGQVLGTPYYMSPEQIRDEPLDGRSDLFSLGVVLYQCLTGTMPFKGQSLASMTHKILNLDPEPVNSLNPEVPEALAVVVSKALEKAPEVRFQTAAQLVEALTSIEGGGPPTATELLLPLSTSGSQPTGTGTVVLPAEPVGRPRGWWLAAGLGAALSVLAGLIWMYRPEDVAPMPEVPAPVAASEPTPAITSPPPSTDRAEEPPKATPVTGKAHLEIVYTNRLKQGWITVWVDGETVVSHSIRGPKGLFKRAVGQELRDVVPIRPGFHEIEVRVSGREGKMDASNRTRHRFADGQTRRLRVEFIPPGFLRLAWKEASNG